MIDRFGQVFSSPLQFANHVRKSNFKGKQQKTKKTKQYYTLVHLRTDYFITLFHDFIALVNSKLAS